MAPQRATETRRGGGRVTSDGGRQVDGDVCRRGAAERFDGAAQVSCGGADAIELGILHGIVSAQLGDLGLESADRAGEGCKERAHGAVELRELSLEVIDLRHESCQLPFDRCEVSLAHVNMNMSA